ncbi:MAG: Asp-tRNA(Asn)/Glu-tRNA(Gln) amidotransferase subunit GatB [Clostridiaceae bacterium]|nr:Asp-tRNA(Asn)/Glu-tRNA(Gln) amidotransferase subunit GatB [Clostridiaceae bacterium]
MKYEAVIGLEVHVKLKTNTKLFCSCRNEFGKKPNTLVCPVCTGMPGTLPRLNKEAVNLAIKAGLGLNCKISKFSRFDRKNYYYPDLPKGYQTTQYEMPLCTDGYIDIGGRKIGIERIHLEEDAGKLIHEGDKTYVDFNRSGVPLVEIVSRPDIGSGEEAALYLKKLRGILLFTGVSDCKINEGSMRVDVNVSVRPKGSSLFGAKTEIKNINSFQFTQEAIEYEIKRHMELYEEGNTPQSETRRYDEKSKKTYAMRTKEDSSLYMYLPDTEFVPLYISEEEVDELRKKMPLLPEEREKIYVNDYGLTDFDCENILQEVHFATCFEEAAKLSKDAKNTANLLISHVFSLLDSDKVVRIKPSRLAEVSNLMTDEVINSSTAKKLLEKLWEEDFDVETYVKENELFQINDKDVLSKFIEEAAEENKKIVDDYKKGKKKALKALTGIVMAKAKGRANPKLLNTLINEMLG